MWSSSAKGSPHEPAGICRPLCILQLKHHLVPLSKLSARNYWGIVAWYADVCAGNLFAAGEVFKTVMWFHVEQYKTLEVLRVNKRSSGQADVQFSLNIDLFIALSCMSLAFWPFNMCWVCHWLFRHYSLDAYLPLRLRPESMEKLHCLRACVIRSLYHMYEPFASRVSRNPAIPDSTPSTLKNSRVSGITKEVGYARDVVLSGFFVLFLEEK